MDGGLELPISEQDISKALGREVRSPVLISSLDQIDEIDSQDFLDFFSPLFSELDMDYYDVKREQYEQLCTLFPEEEAEIKTALKAYYLGQATVENLDPWLSRVGEDKRLAILAIQPWRRRSVAKFRLQRIKDEISISRQPEAQFSQALDSDDLRSWPRKFMEAPARHVENDLFSALLREVYTIVEHKSGSPFSALDITSHFMSVRAIAERPGDNSPEGAHEDGVDYIISALVVRRENLRGGESQIIEKHPSGQKDIIFRRTLAPGEFIFQADTGDEHTYGTDLWHHVTPFHPDDVTKEGWRDIIGFDVETRSSD